MYLLIHLCLKILGEREERKREPLEKEDALGKARWKQGEEITVLLMFAAFQTLQGVSNECRAGEIAPCVKCFTWPLVKPDTAAPIYDPSMSMPGNGKQGQEIPQKGRGKGSYTFIIEGTNLFCRRKKKSWLVDFILASPVHQLY